MTISINARELAARPAFVYVATSGNPALPVKVGVSVDAAGRAKQAGSALASATSSSRAGVPFSLAYAEPFDTRAPALKVEDTAIEILQPYRRLDIGLEWFGVSAEKAIEAVRQAANMVSIGKEPSIIRYHLAPGARRSINCRNKEAFLLGRQAKEAMKLLKMSHSDMAGKIGVPVREVSRIGIGGYRVNVDLTLAIKAELEGAGVVFLADGCGVTMRQEE